MSRYRTPQPQSIPYIIRQGYDALTAETSTLGQSREEVPATLNAAAAEGDRSEYTEHVRYNKELAGLDRHIGYLQKRMPNLMKVLWDCSTAGVGRLFIVLLLVVSGLAGANDSTSSTNAIMAKVEYELPYELGTLIFQVPSHWAGARADNVEALWINQEATSFKDNVTLKVRSLDKFDQEEELLDQYMAQFVANVIATPVSAVYKVPGRRFVSFDGRIEGKEIQQHHLAIYTETAENSFLVTLTYTHAKGDELVDITVANIK